MSTLDHAASSNSGIATCPHLGISEDPLTCLAYPSEWNLCHHARPVALVRLDHQRKTCLSPRYMFCPVYQNKKAESLPKRLQIHHTLITPKKIALFGMAVLLVGFVVGWIWLSLY